MLKCLRVKIWVALRKIRMGGEVLTQYNEMPGRKDMGGPPDVKWKLAPVAAPLLAPRFCVASASALLGVVSLVAIWEASWVVDIWGGGWGFTVVHKMWGFPGHLVHYGIDGGLVWMVG